MGEFLSLNMAETACPLAQATGEGLADMSELAIAQVQTEFFKRIEYLDPRVVPAIGTIEALQIGLILCDGLWMDEGEGQFVSPHGEHPSDTVGRGLQLG